MTVEQRVATFPILDGELILWEPEDNYGEVRNRCCHEGGELTDEQTIACAWTDKIVQELWSAMLQEGSTEMDQVEQETIGWEDLDKLARGPVDTAPEIDIDEPSYFTEILMGERDTLGPEDPVRLVVTGFGGQFGAQLTNPVTPEMIEQRENLNRLYNGTATEYPDAACGEEIRDQHRTMEVVCIGENFGLAKCKEGSVFIPKSTLKHIVNVCEKQQGDHYDGSIFGKGSKFEAWITYTGGKYPWRITYQGVTAIY